MPLAKALFGIIPLGLREEKAFWPQSIVTMLLRIWGLLRA